MSTTTPSPGSPERVRWKSSTQLEYAIGHVFLPAHRGYSLPDHPVEYDDSLARAVCVAAHAYSETIGNSLKSQWRCITKMLDNLQAFLQPGGAAKESVLSQLHRMQTRDVLVFVNQSQNAGVIFTKQDDCTLYQSFQAPQNSRSKFKGSCNEWAIEIPDHVFCNQYFQSELASFLLHLDGLQNHQIFSEGIAMEFTRLLTSILRSVGRSTEVPCITEPVRSHYKLQLWNRSLLWLLIKVVVQSYLRDGVGSICYKEFMLCIMCNLAKDAVGASLSSDLLHAISSKLLRRFWKFGSPAPDWLRDMVLKTTTSVRETLEARWEVVVADQNPHPFWKPSQLYLAGNTQLSLLRSKSYICDSLKKLRSNPPCSPFHPEHLPRGMLSDFLSSDGSFFEEAYRADPYVTLYDVEQAVEQEIDDWVACVTDLDQACIQLAALMDRYLSRAQATYGQNPEHISIMLLMAIELWVALDKLVTAVDPILADFSPEIPAKALHRPLLRKMMDIHRLRHAYQYLSARHSRSILGKSVFSDEFTKKMLPVRYYVHSPDDEHSVDTLHHIEEHGPTIPPDSEIAVFELRCSRSLHIWRSCTAHLRDSFFRPEFITNREDREKQISLIDIPRLQPYLLRHSTSPVTGRVYLTSFSPKGLRPHKTSHDILKDDRTQEEFMDHKMDDYFAFRLPSSRVLHGHMSATSHTSNRVLSDQAECPDDLPLHEFIAFGHLRSGGSLQWVNILQVLRSRALNFHRHDVYLLLTQASSQVGPLDLNTAEWVWHQELQELSFCFALLDELESLLVDVGAHFLDGVMMGIISSLLTRLLSSSPCEDVSERAIQLLHRVLRETFEWVQELSYNLMIAPTNTEWSNHMRDMAAICRSTVDVGPDIVPKVLCSAEEVDALLTCAILLRAYSPTDSSSIPEHSRLLLERNQRLSLAIENVLRDVILADGSNRGIDIAVRNIWSGYRPGLSGWHPLPYPNARWLTTQTAATGCRRSQTMHLNLLDGSLLVDGKPIDSLPQEIREQPTYKRVFGDQCFLVVASDLPGMDFSTLALIFDHQVHFAMQGGNLVIQAQHKDVDDIVLEVIPQEKLLRDIPTPCNDGHVHWLNLSTSTIEVRPLKKIWEQSQENWRIDCASGQYRMYRGLEWLVDIRSQTWGMVSSLLRGLDVPENLIITMFPIDAPQFSPTQRLSVHLPRYRLSFFVNQDGELESLDFKNMVYDENQCIGTLFGLENRLVLRSNIQAELSPKCIIIPEGQFTREQHNHHIHIRIVSHEPPTRPIVYYTYHLDAELGCLTGYTSWESRLYLACLHAETSVDWMPDPLTGRTGIEEALCLLLSAGCQSFMEFDALELEAKFSSTVNDEFYAQIKFAMQRIWNLIRKKMYLFHDPRHMAHDDVENNRSRLTKATRTVIDALRTAYLFPLKSVGPKMPMPTDVKPPKFMYWEPDDSNRKIVHPPVFECSEREDLACTLSLAVYHWLINMENEVEERDDIRLVDTRPVTTASPWISVNSDFIPPSIAQVDSFLQETNELPLQDELTPDIPPPSIAEVEVFLQQATEAPQRFRLLFLLPTIVFSRQDPQPHFLSILVALAKRLLKNLRCYDQCQPLDGYRPSDDAVWRHFSSVHISQVDRDRAVDMLFMTWALAGTVALVVSDSDPLRHVKRLSALFSSVISLCSETDVNAVNELNTKLQTLFFQHYPNLKLKQHLTRRFAKLETKNPRPAQSLPTLRLLPCISRPAHLPFLPHFYIPWQGVSLGQLLCTRSPPTVPLPVLLRRCNPEGGRLTSNSDTLALNRLFDSLQSNTSFQQRYISSLHDSAQHVREAPHITCGRPSIEDLKKHCVQCRLNYTDSLDRLKKELGPTDDPLEQVLHRSGQWPRITPYTLFQCLASTSPIKPPEGWKKCLISLGLLLAELQRSRRLLQFALGNLDGEFSRELENEGCDGWSAEDYPDWLLIQLQGNFLVRKVQADVAMEMASPLSRRNTAMQVNMGEGKSSVILPISAATLANGNQLVRVIVPKALTVQTFRVLVNRLGGLVNRPIYHLPFSRSFTGKYRGWRLTILRELLSQCVQDRAVLVVQPEHVLLLKLSSVEAQLKGHESCAWMRLQKWLDCYVRDILDESDEVLHPRFQLAYTVGPERHVEGYPDRWTITQHILRMLKGRVLSLSHDLPDAIQYERNPSGSFPRLRILRAAAVREHMTSLIVNDVMAGHLPGFSFRDIERHGSLHTAVSAFISSKEVSKQRASMVEEYARKTGLWDGILLLRGLLACGILWFALVERRWRVDYGLSPSRTLLAVPYRAKDVPAPTAEFGHPDLTILLTCLSYYYDGLTEEQLRASFKLLQEQDDSSTIYANWIRDHDPHSVPGSIQDLRNVNTKSSEQWNKYLFPLFARNQGAVDFYLSRIVFPKEANQYPRKLAASSWDLAEMRKHVVTGFSGTNDNQYLLPMSIVQRDPEHQFGANARVLSYILQPENNYLLISDASGERRTTLELLKMVVEQEPKIRVFLDVGAQVLDLSNYQVAKEWLDLSSDIDGAVYFNHHDDLMVLTRDGASLSLLSSPLAQCLDRCVVYLDDAHTRGTDLKLPSGFRAVVTLGPKVTKDRLVQGCMRMRKLGHGHSVLFLAPLEVDKSIRAVAGKVDKQIQITTTDVLHWAIHETWNDIKQRAPHWAQQGIDHATRYDAWSRFSNTPQPFPFFRRRMLANAWLRPESKSLVDLYTPYPSEGPSKDSIVLHNHPRIQEHLKDLGVITHREAEMEEEQEREVNREIEQEREQGSAPPYADPARHCLHPCVVAFVRTGIIPSLFTCMAFHPVFTTLRRSSAKSHIWSPFVLATSDFCRTVKCKLRQGNIDHFLRPVQWVLSGRMHTNRVLVLLSPFEADRLMPDIRASKHAHLHVYIPRTTERMRPADDLMFYSIPPLPDDWTPPWDLIDQLNVFAGQLYLRDYDSYLRTRRFLGAQSEGLAKKVATAVRRNFVTPGVLDEIGDFADSLLPSVTKLLIIRRKGLPFSETHMGRILQGEELTERDFTNQARTKSGHNVNAGSSQRHIGDTTAQEGLASPTLPRPVACGCQ